jgi:hypothetical protein
MEKNAWQRFSLPLRNWQMKTFGCVHRSLSITSITGRKSLEAGHHYSESLVLHFSTLHRIGENLRKLKMQ